jgi:hypothetical protein
VPVDRMDRKLTDLLIMHTEKSGPDLGVTDATKDLVAMMYQYDAV